MKVIEKNTKKEIDWSKGGQLVVSNVGVYVVTSGHHEENGFSGTDLSNGEFTDYWNKAVFTLVESPVTFENE